MIDKKLFSVDKKELLLKKPLGWILEDAGLISESQVQIALLDQNRLHEAQEPHLKIGEILTLRGWIKQKTVDFFVNDFPKLLMSSNRYKIGFYLVSAGLLQEKERDIILREQKRMPMKFGLIAIQKKWIKQKTIDFFINCFQKSDVIHLPEMFKISN
jgi:hypothetical protein